MAFLRIACVGLLLYASDGAFIDFAFDNERQVSDHVETTSDKALKRTANVVGRPAYSGLVLFKGLVLQRMYHLSDVELEEQINDRFSFRRFVGLGVSDDVPDATTLRGGVSSPPRAEHFLAVRHGLYADLVPLSHLRRAAQDPFT